MEVIDIRNDGAVVSLDNRDIMIINNALNEICNGISIFEFDTRIGESRQVVSDLLRKISELVSNMEIT